MSLVALVEGHHPIHLPAHMQLHLTSTAPLVLAFAEVHHQIPIVALTIQHVIPRQLPQEAMEAGHGRYHTHIQQGLGDVPLLRRKKDEKKCLKALRVSTGTNFGWSMSTSGATTRPTWKTSTVPLRRGKKTESACREEYMGILMRLMPA